MAEIVEDRVLETTNTAGPGPLALAAAVSGFRRFSAVCAVGDTVQYFIEAVDAVGLPTGEYEYGIGTYSAANELTRTTVLGSSNAGALVDFAAGPKNVGMSLLASQVVRKSQVQGGSAGSGYWRKHPDGTIEQWGAISSTSNVADTVVAFPIPFPTQCESMTGNYVHGALNAPVFVSFAGVIPTQFACSAWNGNARAVASVYWRAVGR